MTTPQNTDPSDTPSTASDADGPEAWVPDAIAQQEEHLKRTAPCEGVRFREHTFREFGVPGRDGRIRREHFYEACIVCGVTRTDDDYQRRLAGRRAQDGDA